MVIIGGKKRMKNFYDKTMDGILHACHLAGSQNKLAQATGISPVTLGRYIIDYKKNKGEITDNEIQEDDKKSYKLISRKPTFEIICKILDYSNASIFFPWDMVANGDLAAQIRGLQAKILELEKEKEKIIVENKTKIEDLTNENEQLKGGIKALKETLAIYAPPPSR